MVWGHWACPLLAICLFHALLHAPFLWTWNQFQEHASELNIRLTLCREVFWKKGTSSVRTGASWKWVTELFHMNTTHSSIYASWPPQAPPMAKHGVGEAKISSPSHHLWSVPYSKLIFLTKTDQVLGMGSQKCSWDKLSLWCSLNNQVNLHTWKFEKDWHWKCQIKGCNFESRHWMRSPKRMRLEREGANEEYHGE